MAPPRTSVFRELEGLGCTGTLKNLRFLGFLIMSSLYKSLNKKGRLVGGKVGLEGFMASGFRAFVFRASGFRA